MPPPLENHIVSADPNPKDHTVRLTWANGERTVADFSDLVGKGVFEKFADPDFFARVSVGPNGQSLEWPDEIEVCADGLWFEAHPEDNPFAGHIRAAE